MLYAMVWYVWKYSKQVPNALLYVCVGVGVGGWVWREREREREKERERERKRTGGCVHLGPWEEDAMMYLPRRSCYDDDWEGRWQG